MEGQVEDIEMRPLRLAKETRKISLTQAKMENATNEKPTCIGRNSPWSCSPNGQTQSWEFL
jgi:hypothetical protein